MVTAKTSKETAHFLHVAALHDSEASRLETMEPARAAHHRGMAKIAHQMAHANHFGYDHETGHAIKNPSHTYNHADKDEPPSEFLQGAQKINTMGTWLRQRNEEAEEIKGQLITEVKHYQMRLQNDPTMTNRQKYYLSLQKLKEYKELTAILER